VIEELIEFDVKLFLILNNLGSSTFDFFWLLMSNKFTNICIYCIMTYIYYNQKGKNSTFFLIFLSGILVLITDQSTNFFKFYFQRLRPCYNDSLIDLVRLVNDYCGGKYSFFSAHSSNSFALATFFSLIFYKLYKPIFFCLFLFASLISYSRIYLGVHFPLDVFFGSFFGISLGLIFYRFSYWFFKKKYPKIDISF